MVRFVVVNVNSEYNSEELARTILATVEIYLLLEDDLCAQARWHGGLMEVLRLWLHSPLGSFPGVI